MDITEKNFGEVLKSGDLVLIDFYADWCGPCKMQAPIVKEISEGHKEIVVGKINVDDEPTLSSVFRISSIPTLVALRNGKEIGRLVGYHNKNDILNLFK